MSVSLENVSVHYVRTAAVVGASMTARSGRVLALVGPNGSGKSSLLKAIAGVQAHEGVIKFDGSTVRPRRGQGLAYLPQQTGTAAALSVLEVVLLGRLSSLTLQVRDEDLEAAEQTLAALGLTGLADRLIGELSGGQRQLVLLAQAITSDPRVLLLDEPTSALDLRHQYDVLVMTRRLTDIRPLTTIVVLHDLNAALRYADDVAVLSAGTIVAFGAPHSVLTPGLIARVFDIEVAIAKLPNGDPWIAVP